MLCCTILYCTILYYTILYYTILYYIFSYHPLEVSAVFGRLHVDYETTYTGKGTEEKLFSHAQ